MVHAIIRPIGVLCAVLLLMAGWSPPAQAAYRTSAAQSWVPNGPVRAIERVGSVVYIGGDFTSLRNPQTGATVGRSRVAALDASTGAPLSFNPGANGRVWAIDVGPNGLVYLGGEFTSAAGRSANRLAAVTSSGAAAAWSASANGTVYDIWSSASGVYVGGAFSTVNGQQRSRAARLSLSSGSVVSDFNARVSGGRVRAITPSPDGSSLILGGQFTSLGGQERNFLGSVSMSSGAVTGWRPAYLCEKCWVLDVASADGRAFAAMAGGGGRAVAWSLSSGSIAWRRGADGDVQAIDVHDGVVYAGGHFDATMTNPAREQLIALSASGGAVLSWQVSFSGSNYPGIWAVHADDTGLRIGGGFTLTGNPAARYAHFPTA